MAQYKLPEKWDEWPTKDVTLGGVKKKAKLDPETNAIYLLDENGNWTGKKGMAPASKPAGGGTDSTSSEEGQTGAAPAPKTKKVKKSKVNLLLVIIIGVLLVLLFTKDGNIINTEKTYEVIIAMSNIQPGEKVTGKLASKTITESEYLKYASEGGMYKPDEYELIQFYVATSFIPQDGYITYANIAKEYNKTNPWTIETPPATITLPISATTSNLDIFLWGNELQITVTTRKVIKNTDYPAAERPSSPGASSSSQLETTQIDTYTLEKVRIIDVLDKSKNSLYSKFASQAAIPTLYREDCIASRYKTLANIEDDTPAYIVVEVPSSLLSWWQQINSSLYTRHFTYKYTGVGCENDLQLTTYTSLKTFIAQLKTRWETVKEAA